MRPIVVKLGGSYAFSPMLLAWLQALERGPGCIALVPGGGPFADAVRTAQGRMGFDDRAADAMALLAMAQYGLALTSLSPRLLLAETGEAFAHAWAAGRVPVWAPARMLAEDPARPASWDVTSDSLALWLARRIGAEAVLLIKHAGVASGTGAAPLLDAAFPHFFAAFRGAVHVAGPAEIPGGAWDRHALPGVAIGAMR